MISGTTYLAIRVALETAGRQFALGMIALQIACLGWALGVMMFVIATARGEWAELTFSSRSLAAEIYLTVAGSLAGYSAYIYALKYLPVSVVSLYAYTNPVIAVLLGAALLAEPFGHG